MKKILIIFGLSLLVLGVVIFINYFVTDSGLNKESVDLDHSIEELESDLNRVKELQEKQFDEMSESEKKQNEGYWEEIDQEMLEKNQNPSYVAKFMLASAKMKDIELFTSAFTFEQFNKDLFESPNENKGAVIEEMMNRITRNNAATQIKILRVKADSVNQTANVKMQVLYSDNEKRNVDVQMVMQGTSHETSDAIYVITTSVWDIIKQIEKE